MAGMSSMRQLRLLLWKNWLQQKRSPWFTLIEMLSPLFFIGLTLGTMIKMRSMIEKEHNATQFPQWPVLGSAYDLVIIPDTSRMTGSIINPLTFLNASLSDCQFLNVTQHSSTSFEIRVSFAFAPKTPDTIDIMNRMKTRYNQKNLLPDFIKSLIPIEFPRNLSISSTSEVYGFDTEAEMVDYMVRSFGSQCGNPLLGGIVFPTVFDPSSRNLNYTIRLANTKRNLISNDIFSPWDTSTNFATVTDSGPINGDAVNGGEPGYWQEGFLTVQHALNVILREKFRKLKPTDALSFDNLIMLGRTPFPAFTTRIVEAALASLPGMIIFSFMSSVIFIVRSIVMEKEKKLKEYMRVMGLSQWLHWIAYFIMNFIKLTLTAIFTTVLLYFIMDRSNPTVYFVFFLLYAFNACTFAFAVSTFLQTATTGTMAANIGWLVLYFWMVLFKAIEGQSLFPFAIRMLNCLNPDIALSYGVNILQQFELQDGMHWSNLFDRSSPDDPLTLGHVFVMLVVDGCIFVLITWYVEAVNPGGEGVPQKPWFFVLKSYWCPGRDNERTSYPHQMALFDTAVEQQRAMTEELGENLETTVRIAGLSKTFGSSSPFSFRKSEEKVAVDNLCLNLYKGQITALLGHNGAGKSTTFSMLTGVIPPSKGTAFIDSMDIRTSLQHIRRSLGLCTQYNILFDTLTVWEHLEFFSNLKLFGALNNYEVQGRGFDATEAEDLLVKLRIDDKKNTRASTLSGGQKRKLSLAIALIGGSEIVMLDEPTSGMDPGARHETWKLLQAEKGTRTILLTTHYMDEADVLGDRIAIMAHGKLHCCGSSMFLKKHYGTGYNLIIDYDNHMTMSLESAVVQTRELMNYHTDVILQSVVGQEATFLLAAESRSVFPRLFAGLESSQAQLGIKSFGVSVTSMEEVFLKVGELTDAENSASVESEDSPGTDDDINLIENDQHEIRDLKPSYRTAGFTLLSTQFYAMLAKRASYFSRRKIQFLPQLIVPVIYLALLLRANQAVPTAKEVGPLVIDLKPYSLEDKAAVIIVEEPHQNVSIVGQVVHAMDSKPIINRTSNMTETVFSLIKNIGSRSFGIEYPVAFTSERFFGKEFPVALFNNFGFATPALAIALADSLLGVTKHKDGQPYVFTAINHPLPPAAADTMKNKTTTMTSSMIIGIGIIVCMSMVVSGYCQFIIREKEKNCKHLQLLSGLPLWMYWLTSFLWDVISFLVPLACIIGIFYAYEMNELIGRASSTFTVILMFLLFVWTAVPYVYTLSFLFKSAPRGYTMINMYTMLSAIIAVIVMVFKEAIDPANAQSWSLILTWVFPVYNLSNMIQKLYNNEFFRTSCLNLDCTQEIFKKSLPQCCGPEEARAYVDNVLFDHTKRGVMVGAIFFVVQGFLFWLLVTMAEQGWIRCLIDTVSKRKKTPSDAHEEHRSVIEDSDVLEEKDTVLNLDPESTAVVVRDLRKRYGELEAVRGVNFHASEGDCFGLLGVNGAGKTSTFRMLTAEESVTSGDAYLSGYGVKKDWREAGKYIGYCPQFDAVLEEMSGEETLLMFARIRGISKAEITQKVKGVIDAVGLQKYAKGPIKTYSGGNKRKLSLGIALVGVPDILLLDEPTTGVDPKARRTIWEILSKVREAGSALVLTSHSMDECEALCTRLAIMVNGQFRCHGTVQHLKSRYGTGYSLLIRLQHSSDAEKTRRRVGETFPGAVMKEHHLVHMSFDVPRSDSLSTLFERAEALATEMDLEDYSFSQPTLEQIFLEFSRASESPIGELSQPMEITTTAIVHQEPEEPRQSSNENAGYEADEEEEQLIRP